MSSLSIVARFSSEALAPADLQAQDRHSARYVTTYRLTRAAALLFSLHCAGALAGDIARDTPAASMALAQGLYATPGQSASVSPVVTPTVTASPLPSPVTTPPPPPEPSAAHVSVGTPSPGVTLAPAAAPQANWTNYVGVVAGLVGAITGIAGAIMGYLGLRRRRL